MKIPKIKDVHGIIYLPNRIRIGTVYGLAIEIDDPNNRFTPFIKMLNGENTIEEIIHNLSGVLSKEEVLDGIDQLLEEGFLEDASILAPELLSEEELQRYKVNLNFFNTLTKGNESKYDAQVKLKNSHILIIGMGGIGSNLCMALAELGIGKITAVDFDTVELSNLNRQVLYSTKAVGKPKTQVAKERINDFNPNIEFNTINKRITSLEDVREIFGDQRFDMVACLADRPTGYIDFWVNQICIEKNIPMIAAVVAKHFGRAYTVIPGETACYNCMYTQEIEENFNIAEETNSIRESGFWTPNGALGPTCMFHGYFLSYEILRYLLKTGPLITTNAIFEINFLTFEQEFHSFKKREDCPACSKIEVMSR